jgi:hypothetical protein
MSGRAHKLEPRLYKRTLSRPVAKELTLLRRALGVHSTTICSNLFSQSQLTISTRFYRIISSESLKVNAVSTVSAFCVHFPLNLEMMPSKMFEGPQQKSASHLHATSSRLPIDSFSRQFPLLWTLIQQPRPVHLYHQALRNLRLRSIRHILWLITSLGTLTRGCTAVKSEDSFWLRGPNQSQSVSINRI